MPLSELQYPTWDPIHPDTSFRHLVSSSGKPLNTVIFTIHKLIALVTVIVTAIKWYEIIKTTEIHILFIGLIILAVLCVNET